MMLLYKAWRESRTRFLLSAAALGAMCVLFVCFNTEISEAGTHPVSFIQTIWRFAYRGYLREFFLIMILLLGVGGLLRERAYGTAVFTLGLPVDRWRLVAARAAVGLLEVAALAVVPAIIIPGASVLVHQSYPISQALQFSVLWTACGFAFFAMAFLFSVILGGDYSAPAASVVCLLVYSGIVELPILRKYPINIHDIMSGDDMPYFQADTGRLIGPFPFASVAVITVVGLGLIAMAARITAKQDF